MGEQMTDILPGTGGTEDNALSERAQRHLWMHFTGSAPTAPTTRCP